MTHGRLKTHFEEIVVIAAFSHGDGSVREWMGGTNFDASGVSSANDCTAFGTFETVTVRSVT